MTESLRDRKKWETRRQLMHEALRLFTEKGYDNVSPAEIAAAANVSTRTFFRYFDTKPDVVFGLQGRVLEGLFAADDVLSAIEERIREYATRVAADVPLYATQARLALDNTPVRIRRLEVILSYEDALHRGFRRESPSVSPVAARQAAMVASHVIVAVMETWVEDGFPTEGPEWDEPLRLMRATVEQILGRS
jgi:AcrR family transcriptional regulator